MNKIRSNKNIKKNRFYYLFLRNCVIALFSVILYYLIFSPYLDNPIEYELKKSNSQLEKEYKALKEYVDIMQGAYDSINQRDKEIYLNLFGRLPVKFSSYTEQHNINTERYNNSSIEDLIILFKSKVDTLGLEIKQGTESIVELEQKMTKLGNGFQNIPSIQPISNPNFDKSFVASGMKLNPFYKGIELHKGFDYVVEEGTGVFATASGVVSQVGNRVTERGGLTIEIDHKNGYKTRYSNLSKSSVYRYKRVSKGDIIGYSGNSGYSFLPHLHYEVLYNRNNLAPANFFFAEMDKLHFYYLQYRTNETIQSLD